MLKVKTELKNFGHVRSYDKFPDEEQGNLDYEIAIKGMHCCKLNLNIFSVGFMKVVVGNEGLTRFSARSALTASTS